MSDYLNGCDILGSDWGGPAVVLDDPSFGTPAVIEDADWGVPVEVMGEVEDVLGLFDLNDVQKQMNSLKQVPVSVAQALLRGGQTAINQAITTGNAKSLPGSTDRSTVAGKLQWHADALRPFTLTPNVIYFSGDDLKHWVTQAMIEANAAEVGAEFLDNAWDTMWREITTAVAALPAEIRKDVGNVVSNVTGLPLWVWLAIALGAIGAVSFLAVKLADTKLGAAVGGRLIP